MRTSSLLIPMLAAALSACGWSERRFEVVGIEALCDAAAACAGTYEAVTCVDRLRSTDRSACDYDPRAASRCVDALPIAQCQPIGPFDLFALALPTSCFDAYACDWIDLGVVSEGG